MRFRKKGGRKEIPCGYTIHYMPMNENIFKNELRDRVIRDYTQFPYRVLTGVRGTSKTFPVQQALLDDYFDHGKFFAVMREKQAEVDEMMRGGFWDEALISQPKYNGHVYATQGNQIIIDGIAVGIAIAMTTYGNVRGSLPSIGEKVTASRRKALFDYVEEAEHFVEKHLDDLRSVFFDEFIPIKPMLSQNDRKRMFLHILETLFRFREGRICYLCGNITMPSDIILEELNFKVRKEITYGIRKSYTLPTEFNRPEPLAVWYHMPPNKEWIKARANSMVGKVLRGKEERDAAMFMSGKTFAGDSFSLIENKSVQKKELYTLTDGVAMVSVWITKDGELYIMQRKKKSTVPIYCTEKTYIAERVKIVPKYIIDELFDNFDCGNCRFEDARAYTIFLSLLPNKKQRSVI